MDDDEIIPLVFDIGTDFCKCGVAGDDEPRAIVPVLVGSPLSCETRLGQQTYVGQRAVDHVDQLSVKQPMEHGHVTDWESMQTVLKYCFDSLSLNPTEHPLLYTEAALTPVGQQEKFLQLMFENFNVPGARSQVQSQLSVYASGRSVAMVVECGAGVTQVTPVWEGYTPPAAVKRVDFGGRDLTRYLGQLLSERGHAFPCTADLLTLDRIKTEKSVLAMSYDADIMVARQRGSLEESYQLPNGKTITLAEERYKCPEALFNPTLMGSTAPGLHQTAMEALSDCPVDIRRDLMRNIFLTGDSTCFPGFVSRMQREMEQLAPPNARLYVRGQRSPLEHHAWVGGSIVASLSSFQRAWITAADYAEFGPHCVHRLETYLHGSRR